MKRLADCFQFEADGAARRMSVFDELKKVDGLTNEQRVTCGRILVQNQANTGYFFTLDEEFNHIHDVGVEASHNIYPEYQSLDNDEVNPIHRTGYHFQPQKHWINDPNGPMYFNGIYHLFYQYNPWGAEWGNIVWAHSVSKDMINWESLEPAVLPGNKPVIMYTCIDLTIRQLQNYAIPKNVSDPYLREWIKPDNNPIAVPDKSENASAFHDPTTAWKGGDGHWRIVVGGKRNHRGMAHLYRSKDFKNWIKARHPLHSVPHTGMWECPDFYLVSLSGSKTGLDTSAMGQNIKHVFK
ncbi:beta-fructofuranosidase, insoluble isoenzyme CWINV4-like, partial [Humulus lupulus]|uniref:beta-fructofuranosidase, insoluble isoenzyme CWINV4-like n=1 Tax=Humulus lupulus TaxID=3486 RepID=UPI002B4155B1